MQHYIDNTKNNVLQLGTTESPYHSFAQVQNVVQPGDTVLVKGIYHEVIKWRKSGKSLLSINIILLDITDTDSCIDGKYLLPMAKDERVGAEGLKGNDSPLVLIDASFVIWSVPIKNSRGRGIQFGTDKNTSENGTFTNSVIDGCRTAPIDARNVKDLTISYNRISDTSNYNTKVRDSKKYNYAGCIKTLKVDGLNIIGNVISNHYGNVITPSRGTKNIVIKDNAISDCWGSFIYLHFCNTAKVTSNFIYYTSKWKQSKHAGIVVNNEEEFLEEGNTPGNFTIYENYILGTDNGIALWGNEGSNVITTGIQIFENWIINTSLSPILVRDGRKVKDVKIFKNNISVREDFKGPIIEVKRGYENLVIENNGFPEFWPLETMDNYHVKYSDLYTADTLNEFMQEIQRLTTVDQTEDSDQQKLKLVLRWKLKFNTFKDQYAKELEELYQELKIILEDSDDSLPYMR